MKRIYAALRLIGATFLVMVSPAFASNTSVHLHISPTVCLIDVIQDGSNQTIQTPSADCEAVLPNLLSAQLGQGRGSTVALPFAGQTPLEVLLSPRPQVRGVLTAVSSPGQENAPVDSSTNTWISATTGIGLVALAAGVGIDMALFEFSYFKKVTSWVQKRTSTFLFKE